MRCALLILAVTLAPGAFADPPAASHFDLCQALNNRILHPRSPERPLPLLAGDPAHGLHPACAVRWSALSPNGKPLEVIACYQGSLLQIGNDSACGVGTGPLWVNSRWVATSADPPPPAQADKQPTAMCQSLETHALAGTRDINPCEERKELAADAAPAKPAAAPAKADAPTPK